MYLVEEVLYILVFASAGYTFLSYLYSSIVLLPKRRHIEKDFSPAISILKPIKGVDDGLEENLRSFYKLNYPNYELLFGIADSDDPAIPIVQRLIKEFPHVPSKLVIKSKFWGANPKINNLQNLLAYANSDYVLISDSNIRVEGDYLYSQIQHFKDEKVGLVSSTIQGVGAGCRYAAMENVHLNTHIAATILFMQTFIRIPIIVGKSMLLKREVLEKIGGFLKFRQLLAEDYLMGKAVKKAGFKVKISDFQIQNYNQNWGRQRFFNRHIRWAKIRKNISAFSYAFESLSHPIPVAVLPALLFPSYDNTLFFLFVCLFKIAMDFALLQFSGSNLKWRYLSLIPIKDLIMGIIWYMPWFSNKVNWRGNSFKIKRNTELKIIGD